MGPKRRWGSKKAEKESERLEREEAEKKAKDRADSDDRHENIKVRWDLDEQQLSASKNPRDRKLTEQKLKKQKFKDLLKSIRDSTENDDLVDRISELIELVLLQDLEIEYLMKFRRDWEQIEAHYPDRLEDLLTASLFPIFRPGFAAKRRAVRVPQNWERKRQRYKLSNGVGLIEYEFGGAGEAERRKHSLSFFGLPYQPTCLDKIFGGGSVKMHESNGQPGLQNLFGMHRNRLKNLPAEEKGRETWYDYRAVVKIMDRLLSEQPRESETPTRGRTTRPWPSNPGLRRRMLTGIVARMDSLSVSEDICGTFLALTCHHLGIGETPTTEHLKKKVAALVRRYLPDSAKK